MKFIDMIVDFILDKKPQVNASEVKSTTVYLPCNEIFGNLSKEDKPNFLSYNHINADFVPEKNLVI